MSPVAARERADYQIIKLTRDGLMDTRIVLKAAIDQAADIGGGPQQIRDIADALGLIAEKGELDAKVLLKLAKVKIVVPPEGSPNRSARTLPPQIFH